MKQLFSCFPQILQTVPFDRVDISVISLHFVRDEDKPAYMTSIRNFLFSQGFQFVRRMEHNYFYQAMKPPPQQQKHHNYHRDQTEDTKKRPQ